MNDSMQTHSQAVHETLTPLAEFLAAENATALTGTYPDESRQLSALLDGAAAFDLGSISQIEVVGEDRVRWLNGMVTNSIQALEEGHGNYSFILNAQGRIQGDAYIYRHGDRLLLHTSQSQRLIDHLDHFIIMDDVELKPSTDLTALGLAGPGSLDLLARIFDKKFVLEPHTLIEVDLQGVAITLIRSYEVVAPHYELWFDRRRAGRVWQALLDAGATACGGAAVEALRIIEGIPAYGIDLRDRDLPQETGQTRALSFSKGCYLGQEIVERIRSRGNVHRSFQQMELTGNLPATPAELRVDGKSVGQITSAASVTMNRSRRLLALGFLRSEILSGSPRIEYDGGIAIPIDRSRLAAEFPGHPSIQA